MVNFWPICLLVFAMVMATGTVSERSLRRHISNVGPILAVAICFALGHLWGPGLRLLAASAALLYVFKCAALLRQPLATVRSMSPLGKLIYLTVWPGIDPTPMHPKPVPAIEDHGRFAAGLVRAICGLLGLGLVAWFCPVGAVTNYSSVADGVAILCILLTVHMGVSDMLTEAMHALGWPVKPLFDAPWRSGSLADFWSRRWNRPFVELDRIFFLPWLSRRFGVRWALFGVFVISGLLHEFAISYPAGAGWGGPLLYFVLQGVFVSVERKRKLGPLWVALVVLGPVAILFHAAFRTALIRPLMLLIHDLMVQIGIDRATVALVIFLGVAQFLVLLASFQVPTRLRWKEELPRLSTLNHKLMWTYGSFIVYTIVSFGVITLFLRDDIVRGTRAGLAISTFIFLFWGFRLAIDTFYFRSSDWPKGPFMQIGHVMLNALFTSVFLGYGTLIAWNLAR